MNTVGSFRSLSTRFEAKHRPLKQYAQATASRRNMLQYCNQTTNNAKQFIYEIAIK